MRRCPPAAQHAAQRQAGAARQRGGDELGRVEAAGAPAARVRGHGDERRRRLRDPRRATVGRDLGRHHVRERARRGELQRVHRVAGDALVGDDRAGAVEGRVARRAAPRRRAAAARSAGSTGRRRQPWQGATAARADDAGWRRARPARRRRRSAAGRRARRSRRRASRHRRAQPVPADTRIATILRSRSSEWHNRGILAAPLAVAPDASWTFEPGAIVLVAALTFLYVRRWREIDGSAGPPDELPRRDGARADRAVLADRPPRRAAVPHAHGPAPAAARPRADPRAAGAHEGAAAPAHATARAHRAPRGTARAPGLRDRALRRHDGDLAHPRDVRRRARAPGAARPRARDVRRSRAGCTGGICSRRSAPASASAGWARSSTCSPRRSSSA